MVLGSEWDPAPRVQLTVVLTHSNEVGLPRCGRRRSPTIGPRVPSAGDAEGRGARPGHPPDTLRVERDMVGRGVTQPGVRSLLSSQGPGQKRRWAAVSHPQAAGPGNGWVLLQRGAGCRGDLGLRLGEVARPRALRRVEPGNAVLAALRGVGRGGTRAHQAQRSPALGCSFRKSPGSPGSCRALGP